MRRFVLHLFLVALVPGVAFSCPTVRGLIDVNCDGVITLAAVGDSITYGIGDKSKDESGKLLGYPGRVQNRINGLVIVNIGKPGATAQAIYRRVVGKRFQARLATADYAIVLGGVNNFWAHSPASYVTLQLRRSVSALRDRYGAVTVASTLLHTFRSYQQPYVDALNVQILKESSRTFPVALRFDLIHILLSGDGLHPAPPGYVQIADSVVSYLRNGAQTRAQAFVDDTDDDGLYRFEESARGTNASRADTDGDELSDGSEVFTYGTNPLLSDTDGDSIADGLEVSLGRNPNSAD